MTKQDVLKQIGQRTGKDPLISRVILESFFKVVKQHLAAGESIYVRGFGSFQPKRRAAKVGRNIPSNTAMAIPAHTIPAFKPSPEFIEQVQTQRQPSSLHTD